MLADPPRAVKATRLNEAFAACYGRGGP